MGFVTGDTGFVANHTILQLLQKGYQVRTTLRSVSRKDEILNMLKNAVLASFENLDFIETDLLQDTNWDNAVKGCEYVLHIASPIFLKVPKMK